MSIAIIYGSNGGVTEDVAEQIKDVLRLEADLLDILHFRQITPTFHSLYLTQIPKKHYPQNLHQYFYQL